MSAETLRRAAALMRERAEAANLTAPSPWLADGAEITTDDQEPIEPLCVVTSGMHWQEAHSIRMHVASWHPAVAIAVADWLDNQAYWLTCDECGSSRDRCLRARQKSLNVRACCPDCSHGKSAMKTARAYLGEAS